MTARIIDEDEETVETSETFGLTPARYPKEAFIDQDRVQYFDWGSQEGRSLGQGLDIFLWNILIGRIEGTNVIEVADNLVVSLKEEIDKIPEEERNNVAILFSAKAEIRYGLWGVDGFVPAFKLGKDDVKGFYGEFYSIPVFTMYSNDIDGVVIFDKRFVSYIESQPLEIDIRELTDEEVTKISQEQKTPPERLREEVFVHGYLKFVLKIRTPVKAMLLKIKREES